MATYEEYRKSLVGTKEKPVSRAKFEGGSLSGTLSNAGGTPAPGPAATPTLPSAPVDQDTALREALRSAANTAYKTGMSGDVMARFGAMGVNPDTDAIDARTFSQIIEGFETQRRGSVTDVLEVEKAKIDSEAIARQNTLAQIKVISDSNGFAGMDDNALSSLEKAARLPVGSLSAIKSANQQALDAEKAKNEVAMMNAQAQGMQAYASLAKTYGDQGLSVPGWATNMFAGNNVYASGTDFTGYNPNNIVLPNTGIYKATPTADGGITFADLKPLSYPSGSPTGRNQCGEWVNDTLGSKIFGNTLYDKVNVLNSLDTTKPVVGAAYVVDNGTWTGHTGIVTKVYQDGSFDYADSNQKGDGLFRTGHISNPSASGVRGYYVPGQPKEDPKEIYKNITLAQIRTGQITKTNIGEDKNKAIAQGWGSELEAALNDPKNTPVSATVSETFSVPLGITTGQLNDIVDQRERNGYGTQKFQAYGKKEADSIAGFSAMHNDLIKMEALKKGSDYLKTLSQRDRDMVLEAFPYLADPGTLKKIGAKAANVLDYFVAGAISPNLTALGGELNTGPLTGLKSEVSKLATQREMDLKILTGKYTVEYMKSISGVAISEQEAQRLQKLLPNIYQDDKLFDSTLKNAQQALGIDIKNASAFYGFKSADDLFAASQKPRSGPEYDVTPRDMEGNSKQNIDAMFTTLRLMGQAPMSSDPFIKNLQTVNQSAPQNNFYNSLFPELNAQ